jgi:hypothetical protein
MNVNEYRSALQSELDDWKERVRNHIGKFEDLPPEDKKSVGPFVSELKEVIQEHTRRMERLNEDCRIELEAVRPHRDGSRMQKFWDDVAKYRRFRPHL